MTIHPEIIELVMKEGWDERAWFERHAHVCMAIVLDPTFWIAIKKAKGWDKPKWFCESYEQRTSTGERRCTDPYCTYAGWKDINGLAHNLYSLILEGGDTAPFWEEILNQKTP